MFALWDRLNYSQHGAAQHPPPLLLTWEAGGGPAPQALKRLPRLKHAQRGAPLLAMRQPWWSMAGEPMGKHTSMGHGQDEHWCAAPEARVWHPSPIIPSKNPTTHRSASRIHLA